jgi:hypothetical protein
MEDPYPLFYYHARLYRVKIKTILTLFFLTLIHFIIFGYIFYQLFHINKTVDYVERISGEDIENNEQIKNNVSIKNSTYMVLREEIRIMSTTKTYVNLFSPTNKSFSKRNVTASPKYKIVLNTTSKSMIRNKINRESIVNVTRFPQGRLPKFSTLLIKSKNKVESGYGIILSNGTLNGNNNSHKGKVCRRRGYIFKCKKIREYVSICRCRLKRLY